MPRLLVLLVLVLLVVPGCRARGEKPKPTFKVNCIVQLEAGGAPTDAIVVFHPQNAASKSRLRPRGRVGEDGKATLSTYLPDDGIPEGEYVVTVVWPIPRANNRPEESGEEVDLLGNRYKEPLTSPLRRTIKPGDNEIEPIVVSQ